MVQDNYHHKRAPHEFGAFHSKAATDDSSTNLTNYNCDQTQQLKMRANATVSDRHLFNKQARESEHDELPHGLAQATPFLMPTSSE
jgi:hypothetical protein